jgi:hypothetical protein
MDRYVPQLILCFFRNVIFSSRFELGTSKLVFFLYITVGSYNSGNCSYSLCIFIDDAITPQSNLELGFLENIHVPVFLRLLGNNTSLGILSIC